MVLNFQRMHHLISVAWSQTRTARMARGLGKYEVIEELADVMLCRRFPDHIHSDNGPEFVKKSPLNSYSRFPNIYSISMPH
jgi:hypothetical protein